MFFFFASIKNYDCSRPNEQVANVLATSSYQEQPLKTRGKVADIKSRLIDGLLESMENRFPDDPIIDATSILAFKTWPSLTAKDEIRGFKSYYFEACISPSLNHSPHIMERSLSSLLCKIAWRQAIFQIKVIAINKEYY